MADKLSQFGLPAGSPEWLVDLVRRDPSRVTIGPAVNVAVLVPSPASKRATSRTRRPVDLVAPAVADLPGGGVSFTLPIPTVSEANAREWRDKSNRTRHARAVVSRHLGPHLAKLAPLAAHYHAGNGLSVRLIRLGGRKLDKLANLGMALKAAEDAVALMLGADDGDPRWHGTADQRTGGPVGVVVEVSPI